MEGLIIKFVCVIRIVYGVVVVEFGGEENFKLKDFLVFYVWVFLFIVEVLKR